MLSLESLQGAFKKALVYSNARSAFSPPAKASGDEDEQDFLDGDGNLVDELVALDTIEALPESERAAAIADATARGSFKALQPFITQESPRGTVMEGCIVNASEEDWSVGWQGTELFGCMLSACSYPQSRMCRISTSSIGHTASSRSFPQTVGAHSTCLARA